MGKIAQRQEVIDNLLTDTWYTRIRGDIIDGVSKIRPFWDMMIESGKLKKKAPDGTHWEYNFRYARNRQNVKYIGRGDTFGLAEAETRTVMKFEVRDIGTSMVRMWKDEKKNKGSARIVSYVDELLSDTEMGLSEALSEDLLTQNASPMSINALPTLISTTPTVGTIGTLDRSEHKGLQNIAYDYTGKTPITDLLKAFATVVNKCTEFKGGRKGSSKPDIILTTRKIYQDYKDIANALRQIVTNSAPAANLGFGNLLYEDIPIFWDPDCPAGCVYFLNTDTLEFPYDPDYWFEMTEWKPVHGTSLDRTAQIICSANLICTLPAKNAVIYNYTPNNT